MQVLDGFLQIGVVGERVRRTHHIEAVFNEGADVLAFVAGGQALLDLQERPQVGRNCPALGYGIAEQDVHFAHQRAQALHLVRRKFGHMGATTRQDGDQVPTLKDQQCFAHRAATDIQRQRHFLFLNAFPRL